MKKKRYTKPVVIDLGKQMPHIIENGLLVWNRSVPSEKESNSCTVGAAVPPSHNTEINKNHGDDNKNKIKDDSS